MFQGCNPQQQGLRRAGLACNLVNAEGSIDRQASLTYQFLLTY